RDREAGAEERRRPQLARAPGGGGARAGAGPRTSQCIENPLEAGKGSHRQNSSVEGADRTVEAGRAAGGTRRESGAGGGQPLRRTAPGRGGTGPAERRG